MDQEMDEIRDRDIEDITANMRALSLGRKRRRELARLQMAPDFRFRSRRKFQRDPNDVYIQDDLFRKITSEYFPSRRERLKWYAPNKQQPNQLWRALSLPRSNPGEFIRGDGAGPFDPLTQMRIDAYIMLKEFDGVRHRGLDDYDGYRIDDRPRLRSSVRLNDIPWETLYLEGPGTRLGLFSGGMQRRRRSKSRRRGRKNSQRKPKRKSRRQ